jgi:predicted porin
MKKSLLALAVLGAFAGVASAQSSVTVFGVVDLSLDYTKNGGTKIKSMDSNQLSSNRIGFRGVEDLGNGLSAGFWLEAGMNNDLGTGAATGGGLEFNRRSIVSLMGNFGEVRLGRDYTPTFWQFAIYDVFGANGLGEGLNLSNLNTVGNLGSGVPAGLDVRANNAVSYFLPSNLGGLNGWLQVAAGEAGPGRSEQGALGYAAGPVAATVAYGITKNNINGAPDLKEGSIGATYDFGVIKLYGLINETKFDPTKLLTYELSGGVPIGLGAVNFSFTHAKFSGQPAGSTTYVGSADQFGLQYLYNLSKRTTLYTGMGYVKNKSGAAFFTNTAVENVTAADFT